MMMIDHRSTKWYNRRSRLIWIVVTILMITDRFTITTLSNAQQQPDDNTNDFGCTLCADGSVANFDATIGETSCGTIANAISQTPANSELCVMTQLQGYIYCNCPTYPTDTYCSLCTNDNIATSDDENAVGDFYYNPIPTQNRNMIIPNTNLTCGEAEFIQKETTNNNITGNSSSCTTILPENSAAEYCGCTEMTKRTCFLCDKPEDNTNVTTSMLYLNRLLPPLFTTSCGSLDRSIGLIVPENNNECHGGTNTTIDALLDTIPVPVQEYCGCISSSSSFNISQPLDTCHICNGTQSVRNPNATITIPKNDDGDNDGVQVTCADLELVTTYITNATTYCTTLSQQYERICCSTEDVMVPSTTNNMSQTLNPASSPLFMSNRTAPTTINASNNTSGSSRTMDTIQSSTISAIWLLSLLVVLLF